MNKLIVAGLLSIACIFPQVQAFNIGFLDDAPISRFNDEDIGIMLKTITDALNDVENGVEVEWKNAKTGNHGSITPLDKTVVDNRDCRPAIIKTIAGHMTGSARYVLCKADDGEWHVQTN